MKWGMAAAAVLLWSAAAHAAVTNESFIDESGARVLQEWVVVDALHGAVWKAFTTDAGFAKWAVPVVHITPGNGGLIEFGLSPQSKIGDPGNVRNRILVYMPDRLLIWQNEFVPAGGPFDPQTFASVRTVLSFDNLGNGTTRVTETVIGFGTGAKYDQLYAHLKGGNAEYLTMLADSFHPAK
jgi:uncharacterized protein YndB with AHSA1/START domain